MLKICLTKASTAILLLLPYLSFCQWTTVNVGTTADLSAIDFEGNTIFLGGQQFVKSIDGGGSWEVFGLTDELGAAAV